MIKLFPQRAPTAERKAQIVEATLRLLARTPIEALTTRQLAAELGLSQPALFRHFESREALLLAVVAHARDALERLAVGVVESGRPAVDQLRALGEALLRHVEREPGLPRLLFGSGATASGRVREALSHVVAMQAALAAELVRAGQREGQLSPAVDPEHAATLFVGLLQGLVLRWEIAGRKEPLAPRFALLFELWLHGVAPLGQPRARMPAEQAQRPACETRSVPLVNLDVRPIIEGGQDPLSAILGALSALPPAGVLLVQAPFRPAPLLALLTCRGHALTHEALAPDHHLVEVVAGGTPRIEDLRELEAPGPLERVLAATAGLAPGQAYLARVPREPRLLLPRLRERGLDFAVLERPDGTALLRVARPA